MPLDREIWWTGGAGDFRTQHVPQRLASGCNEREQNTRTCIYAKLKKNPRMTLVLSFSYLARCPEGRTGSLSSEAW